MFLSVGLDGVAFGGEIIININIRMLECWRSNIRVIIYVCKYIMQLILDGAKYTTPSSKLHIH